MTPENPPNTLSFFACTQKSEISFKGIAVILGQKSAKIQILFFLAYLALFSRIYVKWKYLVRKCKEKASVEFLRIFYPRLWPTQWMKFDDFDTLRSLISFTFMQYMFQLSTTLGDIEEKRRKMARDFLGHFLDKYPIEFNKIEIWPLIHN